MSYSILSHSGRVAGFFSRRFTGFGLGFFLCLVTAAFAAESGNRSFTIAAGRAEVTLPLFAQQSGVELVYAVDKVEGIATRPVNGTMSARVALDALLEGTPISAVQDEKTGAFAIKRRVEPPTRREKSSRGNREALPSSSAATATAATGTSTAESTEETLDLGVYEVTVTVQKRPQSVQEVPIAITSLSSRQLERFQIGTLRDLSRFTPNLLVSSFSQSNPTLAIRGAANTFSQIGVNKPVAVVIDDVFIPRNTAAGFELFDLDSVQVLRGPQGTLFGRNVTGGAIVLNTRQPSFSRREVEARIDAGNYDTFKFQGLVSGPLTEKIAAKITVSQHNHSGYGRDRLSGREQDDLESSSLRAQVLAKLTPTLTATVSADYSDDASGGRTLSSKGVGNDGDRRTSELNYPQEYSRSMWGVSGRLDWKAPVGEFAAITAYRESRSYEDYSGVGASYTLLAASSQSTVRDRDHPGTFTQELRYASPRWQRADFVAGVYFLDEDGYRWLQTRAFAAQTGNLVTNQIADQKVQTRSYAGYFDGTWHVSPQLDLTVGARYTVERKEAALIRRDAIAPANNFSASGLSKEWNQFTPRAVLTWTPFENIKLYGSVTQGFTAGGYNTEAATVSALTTPFDPETVTNYELGLKTQFFNKRLRANLAAFDQRYDDKQELYFNSITRILTIVNASNATMRGAELEIATTPVEGLNFTAAYGYLDATYDSFVVPGVLNYTGNPLGSAPRYKVSAGLDYEYRLQGRGFVSAMFSHSRTDGYYTGASKDPNLHIEAYALTNASVGFETLDRRWRVSFWVRNLADTDYVLTPSTQVVLAEYLGEPRTYGVTLGLRF